MCSHSPHLRYRLQIRDVGSGAFGVCKLMEDVTTGERVAVKLMERGLKVLATAQPLAAASTAILDALWRTGVGPLAMHVSRLLQTLLSQSMPLCLSVRHLAS